MAKMSSNLQLSMSLTINMLNHIRGVIVSMFALSGSIVGLSPSKFKPKTIKLVFAASPLRR